MGELSRSPMAQTLKQYLDCVRTSLTASLCLCNFSSQIVERHNKPQIEVQEGKELVLNTIVVARNKQERVKIETSINSVRLSIGIKQVDEVEEILCRRFMRFLMVRAENFAILRRKATDGYDISFLITNAHCEDFWKHKLVDFVIEFMLGIDSEISTMKLSVNRQARIVAKEFLSQLIGKHKPS